MDQTVLINEKRKKQIDRIEKEFGIELETYYKILKKGIWVKEDIFRPRPFRQEFQYHVIPLYIDGEWWFCFQPYDNVTGKKYPLSRKVRTKDYGITYALTKKELKK